MEVDILIKHPSLCFTMIFSSQVFIQRALITETSGFLTSVGDSLGLINFAEIVLHKQLLFLPKCRAYFGPGTLWWLHTQKSYYHFTFPNCHAKG